ncbi:alkaline phosphatase [Acidobacteriota bacterium]
MISWKPESISKRKLYRSVFLPIALGLILGATFSCKNQPPPRNIILMIVDGCGYNCFDMTSLYQHGKTGSQVYDSFPIKYSVSTSSASSPPYDPEKAWASFNFVLDDPTDSAAAATAMASGVKTTDYYVGLDSDGKRLETIIDLAESMGLKTGVVTTVPYCHATPASFLAHMDSRYKYAPIASQIIYESPIDVIMGCGHPFFDKFGQPSEEPNFRYFSDKNTWEALINGWAGADADGDGISDPWTVIQTREEFRALATGSTPPRVFGIVQNLSTTQQGRPGNGQAPPFEVPFIQSVPSLDEMALAALNLLDNDPEGFLLVIEGGAVDWASEDNQAGRMIEEQISFNEATRAVVTWIETHSNWEETLLIVTSDHETGYITGPGSGILGQNLVANNIWNPISSNGKGKIPGMEWHSVDHSNSLVPLFAKGVGSEKFSEFANETDPIHGLFLDNTEIGRLIMGILEEKRIQKID